MPLISTQGQNFEKAEVTRIIKDNLQEDGNRYGEQKVKLKIKTGSLKGKEVEAISPSGTLFGADSVEGMAVIAIVSTAEDPTSSRYTVRTRTVKFMDFFSSLS